jgi:hypothetical protein
VEEAGVVAEEEAEVGLEEVEAEVALEEAEAEGRLHSRSRS